MRKFRKLSLALALLFFLGLSTAPPLITNSPNSGFVGTMDSFFAASISNPQDFAVLVIAPLVAIYALFKYIITLGFSHIEDNLDHNGLTTRRGSDQDLSNTANTAASVMSLTLSFVIVTYYGGSIMFIGLLSAIGALLWFASSFGAGFSILGGEDDGGGNGGGDVPDEINNQLNEVQEELGRLEDIEGRIEDLEQGNGNGNGDGDDDDIPAAVENLIEGALSELKAGEDEMMSVLDIGLTEIGNLNTYFAGLTSDINGKINPVLNDLESKIREWEGSAGSSRSFHDDITPAVTVGSTLGGYPSVQDLMDDFATGGISDSDLVNELNNWSGSIGTPIDFDPGSPGPSVADRIDANIGDALDDSKLVVSYAKTLQRFESSEELEAELEESIEMLKTMKRVGNFIHRLGDDIDVLINEEEYMIEMARRAEQKGLLDTGGGLAGALQSDRQKADQLKGKLQNLRSEYRTAIGEIENLWNNIDNFVKISDTEIGHILTGSGGVPHNGLEPIAFRYKMTHKILNDYYDGYSGSDEKAKIESVLNNLTAAKTGLERAHTRASTGHPTPELESLINELESIRDNL